MRRETLLDFFADLSGARGEFLIHDNGFRSRAHAYPDVVRAARAFAARLVGAGLTKGDTVLVWSENRPEWVVALWGCLLQGIVAVPIDYRASEEFLRRVAGIVRAKLLLTGDEVRVSRPFGGEAPLLWPLAELDWRSGATVPDAALTRDDVAEIIFTSGATAEPKGVVITHRNLLANIVPVEREILKYRKYARPFSPIRFLNLLPLSHMFGQSMATFIPPVLGGTVVFIHGFNPNDIVRQVKSRRISVVVSVPKILDVLREHVRRVAPEADVPPPQKEHFTKRWWRYRRVHRLFGLKFWSFVVGAAPLDPSLEEFWGRLGFAVVQGYGLTETAPIVSLNHPFSTSRGSVGKAIAGVEVSIAPDGEILVRGDNVTKGYYGAEQATSEAFEGGWFHTGDVGEVDEKGRLFIKGRKKEMIVTPEGLNVFPEDVERVVDAVPGVLESAVVGRRHGGEERVHAVVVLEAGADADAVVREANQHLLDHQKVRGISVWPGAELPRTEGTRKLKRRDVREWLSTGAVPSAVSTGDPLQAIVSSFAAGRVIGRATTLDELGLSSLERVELMVALEERFQVTIDEAAFSSVFTVGDLDALVRPDRSVPVLGTDPGVGSVPSPGSVPKAGSVPTAGSVPSPGSVPKAGSVPRAGSVPSPGSVPRAGTELVGFPAWNRHWTVRTVRRASLVTWILPLQRAFARIHVEGREHLDHLDGPVMFAANHQSHMDTPVIFAAMPGRVRARVAVAMAKEFFKAHFFPAQATRREWLTNSLNYYLAAAFFNAFPLPQREAGARQTMRYIGELLESGESVLIYPEGRRDPQGAVGEFRPGVGMIAAKLGVPVVPVRIKGLDRVLPVGASWPTRGPVTVAFGAPLVLSGEDYTALAGQVENAVRAL